MIVPDDTMSPVFSINHIVVTNPARSARPGDDVVVEFDTGEVVIRRLETDDRFGLTLMHYNPNPVKAVYCRTKVRSVEPITFVIRP
jgi:phage repressor protein C with HTH and peptisase S24 domain